MYTRIVEAALECMREHGVRGATTKTVARRAGVSEGSIYNHFTNRSQLIGAAFGQATQTIRHSASELEELVGANTVEENLETLMEAVIEFFGEITPIVGSIMGDPELRSWVTEGTISGPQGQPLTPLTGVIELSHYLELEHQAGRLPNRDSWIACATMLIGACLHYVYIELLSPSGLSSMFPDEHNPVRAYARTVLHTLFDE